MEFCGSFLLSISSAGLGVMDLMQTRFFLACNLTSEACFTSPHASLVLLFQLSLLLYSIAKDVNRGEKSVNLDSRIYFRDG